MKTLWKVFAWILIICALLSYLIGWTALVAKTAIWNIPTEFWFYDAMGAGIIGLFFLIYSVHSKN